MLLRIMPTALIIALAAILAISVVGNIFLYQKSELLSESVAALRSDNDRIHKQIALEQQLGSHPVNNQSSQSQKQSLSLVQSSPPLASSNNGTIAEQQSITAVAVK